MPHKRAKQSVREQKRKERGADLAPPGNTGNGTGISTERIPKSAARVLDAAKIRAEYRQKRARLQIEWADTNDERERISASKPPPRKKRRTDAAPARAEKKGGAPAKAKGKVKDLPVDTIEIQPGESLKHFNRRVEDHMRPLVQSAIRASAATERKERKATTTTTTTSSNQPPQPPTSKAPVKKDAPSSTTAARHEHDDDDARPKEFATTSSAAPRRLNDIAMAPPELKKLPRGATKLRRGGDGDGGGKAQVKAKAGVLSMAQRVMMEAERENAIRRYREMKERKVKEGEGHDHVDGE